MRFENPRESGPVFLVTGLYAAVIDVGFHVEAPPLAPASLLIVALSLISPSRWRTTVRTRPPLRGEAVTFPRINSTSCFA